MSKRGHFQAFVTAEDGSMLRVIGERKAGRERNAVDAERRERDRMSARRERNEARSLARAIREVVGAGVR